MDPLRENSIPNHGVQKGSKKASEIAGKSVKHITDPMKMHPSIQSSSQFVVCALRSVRDAFMEKNNMTSQSESKKPSVALVLCAEGGYGDILFTYKAALGLCDKGCTVEVDILNGPLKSAKEVKKIMEGMPESHRLNLRVASDGEGVAKPDCVIVAPTRPEYDEVLTDFPHLKGLSIEYVREYGRFRMLEEESDEEDYEVVDDLFKHQLSAGIGPGQLGIFAQEGLKKSLTSKERVDELKKLCSLDPKKYAAILNGKLPEEYLQSNKLFFGYAHESNSMERFVETVAYAEKDSVDGDIDIVVPWRKNDTEAVEYNNKCKYDKIALARAGIGRVEIINENGTTIDEITEGGKGKVLRIINIFPLPNTSFTKLLEVSEDLCLITGDQSWNEAILLPDKTILYEKMSWKKDFYDSTRSIAEQEPMLSAVMDAWDRHMPAEEVGRAITDLREEAREDHDAGKISATRRFHDQVVSEDNSLVDNLYNEAVRLSACNRNPLLRAELDKMEEAVKQGFHGPLVVEKSSAALYTALSGRQTQYDLYRNNPKNLEWLKNSELDDLDILNRYQEMWNNVDKQALTEETVDIMQKSFDLFQQLKEKKNVIMNDISKVLYPLEMLSKNSLPSYQRAFQQAQKDSVNSL